MKMVLEIFDNKDKLISSSRNEALKYSWDKATLKWNEHLENLII